MAKRGDKLTRRMIRTESDREAIRQGARFNPETAMYAVWWIERHCRLYEGTNDPLVLMSTADQTMDTWGFHEIDHFDWDDKEFRKLCMERLEAHLAAVEDPDQHVDWQFEFVIQVFGWQMYSEHFKRWIRRFRQFNVWISKKNKKSPTMAAISMYLSLGDGEPGAKTFLLSKTGVQVRKNACRHVQQMWERSPLIYAESKFNQNEMTLLHVPTTSYIEPLSSDNKKRRESNEGLNGNTMVDETHVVDEETVAIVNRAGISRSEPLHGEFSTAGKNIAGYGGKRFTLCEKIVAGTEISIKHYVYIAAAPQDTKPESLRDRKTLIRLAKMANPALGHTVDLNELIEDYLESRRTPKQLREFMMYRLNIWQQEGTPYIRLSDWSKCADPSIRFEDFHGEDCHCAYDLSENTDLASWCWAFERAGMHYFFWDHWLPRPTAVEWLEQFDYLGMEQKKWIHLLPGRVLDEERMFQDVKARAENVRIRSIGYDPAKSKYFNKLLEDEGYDLYLFRQNNREYNPHVERLQTMVIGKTIPVFDDDGNVTDTEIDPESQPTLIHEDNELVNWMIGHCQIDEDRYQYKRPVKPARGDYRKIDGVQTAVMAVRGLTEHLGEEEEPESAYLDRDAPWLKVW